MPVCCMLDPKWDFCYNYHMYTIHTKDGFMIGRLSTLSSAMEAAKYIGYFVTIKGPNDFETCGVFGVDSVEDGKCPDGVDYDWNKANRIGRVKRSRLD